MAETLVRPKRVPMSREELAKFPEGPPYYDYINGEAIEVNRPTGRHQKIVVRLCNLLMDYTHDKQVGDVWADIDVLLPTGEAVGPDISLLLKEHLDRYDERRGDIIGVPDLVVEVSSLRRCGLTMKRVCLGCGSLTKRVWRWKSFSGHLKAICASTPSKGAKFSDQNSSPTLPLTLKHCCGRSEGVRRGNEW